MITAPVMSELGRLKKWCQALGLCWTRFRAISRNQTNPSEGNSEGEKRIDAFFLETAFPLNQAFCFC